MLSYFFLHYHFILLHILFGSNNDKCDFWPFLTGPKLLIGSVFVCPGHHTQCKLKCHAKKIFEWDFLCFLLHYFSLKMCRRCKNFRASNTEREVMCVSKFRTDKERLDLKLWKINLQIGHNNNITITGRRVPSWHETTCL